MNNVNFYTEYIYEIAEGVYTSIMSLFRAPRLLPYFILSFTFDLLIWLWL